MARRSTLPRLRETLAAYDDSETAEGWAYRAGLATSTTRRHLRLLTAAGHVQAHTTPSAVLYQPKEQYTMTADDLHAKLVRALEHHTAAAGKAGASEAADPDLPDRIAVNLVQPLALASIALELRELRLVVAEIPQSVRGICVDIPF